MKCEVCKTVIDPNSRSQKYCSPKCRRKKMNMRGDEKRKEKRKAKEKDVGICEICRKEFTRRRKTSKVCRAPKCIAEKVRRQTEQKQMSLNSYEKYPKDHLDIKNFEYVQRLEREYKSALSVRRSDVHDRSALKIALQKVNRHIKLLDITDPYKDLLTLQREYCRKLEKETLIWNIYKTLNIVHRGTDSYTLEEAGDVLGVSRERARQIETSAMKNIAIPDNSRLLKPYAGDMAVLSERI